LLTTADDSAAGTVVPYSARRSMAGWGNSNCCRSFFRWRMLDSEGADGLWDDVGPEDTGRPGGMASAPLEPCG
jgi:hypothetical protein